MQLPKVPGNWVGVVARIDATTEEVKSFFDPISQLIRNYSWEVSISYMFTRVEQAHNHLLRGAAVKIHSVNAPTANRFVDGQHITVNAGVNWGHGAGVRRDHLLMPDTVLPVVPGVHWRDPRCFV